MTSIGMCLSCSSSSPVEPHMPRTFHGLASFTQQNVYEIDPGRGMLFSFHVLVTSVVCVNDNVCGSSPTFWGIQRISVAFRRDAPRVYCETLRDPGACPFRTTPFLEGLWLQAGRTDSHRTSLWGMEGIGWHAGRKDTHQHGLVLFSVVVKHSSLHQLVLRSNE